MDLIVTSSTLSDVGHTRDENQDAAWAGSRVFLVADGMGGHRGGGLAARIAIDTFRELVDDEAPEQDQVRQALDAADHSIAVRGAADPECAGMGTTLVGLVLVEDLPDMYWLAFNIGDSRLYRLHGAHLHQVTVDHSHVQELFDSGMIGHDQMRSHPRRHVITRSLGALSDDGADFWLIPAAPPERWLLCTDGLSGEVSDDQIELVLRRSAAPGDAARALVQLALDEGGRDNVTVVVVDTTPNSEGTKLTPAQETTGPGADAAASETRGPHDPRVVTEVPFASLEEDRPPARGERALVREVPDV